MPLTSFRFQLAMDTLVSLAGRFPLPGLVRDLNPLDDTHAGQTKFRPFRLIVRERAVYGAYWYDDFGLFGQEMGARDGRERMVGFALLCDYIFILDIVFLFHDSR